MGYTKMIVCLANSRKSPSGRCVAGREVTAAGFGGWIRPVSNRPTRELSDDERRYEDGRDPQILDVIAIEMLSPQPRDHQRENHLIDADHSWAKRGAISWRELQLAIEDPAGPLWLNGHSGSYGRNDRVPADLARGLTRSLYLVRPDHLALMVASEGCDFGPPRRRVRAHFNLGGQSYSLVVTDPAVERDGFARGEGKIELKDAVLCLSLGEIFHGHAYKLAAAVITPRRARR